MAWLSSIGSAIGGAASGVAAGAGAAMGAGGAGGIPAALGGAVGTQVMGNIASGGGGNSSAKGHATSSINPTGYKNMEQPQGQAQVQQLMQPQRGNAQAPQDMTSMMGDLAKIQAAKESNRGPRSLFDYEMFGARG